MEHLSLSLVTLVSQSSESQHWDLDDDTLASLVEHSQFLFFAGTSTPPPPTPAFPFGSQLLIPAPERSFCPHSSTSQHWPAGDVLMSGPLSTQHCLKRESQVCSCAYYLPPLKNLSDPGQGRHRPALLHCRVSLWHLPEGWFLEP